MKVISIASGKNKDNDKADFFSFQFYLLLKDHYDFGMRAVKTVISAAGNLKRENPEMEEVNFVLCQSVMHDQHH